MRDARLLLDGRTDELVDDLESRMYAAADEERFEQAAQLRDTIRTLETLRDRQQKMATPRMGDRDAIGVKLGPAGAVVQVFQVRSGRVVDRVEMVTNADQARDARLEDLLERAVAHAYADQAPPPEVLLPLALPDMDVLAEWLSARAGRQVLVSVPQRGDKRALLDLAERNALALLRLALQRGRRGQLRGARDAAGGAGAAGPAAPHRLLRHLDAAGRRDRRLDGGVRRTAG